MPKFLTGCNYNEEEISRHLKKNLKNRILAGPNGMATSLQPVKPLKKPVEVVKGRILAGWAQKPPEPWLSISCVKWPSRQPRDPDKILPIIMMLLLYPLTEGAPPWVSNSTWGVESSQGSVHRDWEIFRSLRNWMLVAELFHSQIWDMPVALGD